MAPHWLQAKVPVGFPSDLWNCFKLYRSWIPSVSCSPALNNTTWRLKPCSILTWNDDQDQIWKTRSGWDNSYNTIMACSSGYSSPKILWLKSCPYIQAEVKWVWVQSIFPKKMVRIEDSSWESHRFLGTTNQGPQGTWDKWQIHRFSRFHPEFGQKLNVGHFAQLLFDAICPSRRFGLGNS